VIATIDQLRVSPAKSAASHEVAAFEVDHRGLFGDREAMFVEGDEYIYKTYQPGRVVGPGTFLSQREDPVLTQFAVEFSSGESARITCQDEVIEVPLRDDLTRNRTSVSVHSWEGEAIDQGDTVSHWVSERLGRPVRFVTLSDDRPRYVEDEVRLGRTSFTDGFPITVTTRRTQQLITGELERMGEASTDLSSLRTTIVLDGLEVDDERAFPEDYIINMVVPGANGLAIVLRRWKACSRCPIPNTNQETGQRNLRILKALANLGRVGYYADRKKFGDKLETFATQNFIIKHARSMAPGQTVVFERGADVHVEMTRETNWTPRDQV